jgi:hypothetical protein
MAQAEAPADGWRVRSRSRRPGFRRGRRATGRSRNCRSSSPRRRGSIPVRFVVRIRATGVASEGGPRPAPGRRDLEERGTSTLRISGAGPKKTPGGGPASGAFHRARSVLRPRSSGLGGRNRQGRVDPGIADPRNAARSPGKKKHPRGCGRIVPVLWPASQIFVRPAHERLSVRRAPAAVPARISFRKAPPGPWNSFPGTHIPGTSPVPGALSAR